MVRSVQFISQRADKPVQITLQHINVGRNPQPVDMLDLAVFYVDFILLAKIDLKLSHIRVVNRKQAYRTEAVRIDRRVEPETRNTTGEADPISSGSRSRECMLSAPPILL